MIQYIKIYLIAFKNALAARMAYRIDLYLSAVVMFFSEMIVPFVTFLIYANGAGFPGWEFHEAFLVQAVFLLAKGFTFPFFAGIVWNTLIRIQQGTYDLLLIKPRNILFMTVLTGIDTEDLGKLAGGIGIFILALTRVPHINAINWIVFVLLFICAILVIVSFSFIMAGSGFKWVGNGRVYEIFDALCSFSLYPKSIFSRWVQTLITACIPLGLMGFFPASALLGKSLDGLWFSLASCLVLFLFSIFFWNRMLRLYTSAGG